MRREAVPVNEQLDTLLRKQIETNRNILSSLFKTVILCGRNNIALRGHRDDGATTSNTKGNFKSLLHFRVDSGDETLHQHLSNAPQNATYTVGIKSFVTPACMYMKHNYTHSSCTPLKSTHDYTKHCTNLTKDNFNYTKL